MLALWASPRCPQQSPVRCSAGSVSIFKQPMAETHLPPRCDTRPSYSQNLPPRKQRAWGMPDALCIRSLGQIGNRNIFPKGAGQPIPGNTGVLALTIASVIPGPAQQEPGIFSPHLVIPGSRQVARPGMTRVRSLRNTTLGPCGSTGLQASAAAHKSPCVVCAAFSCLMLRGFVGATMAEAAGRS
jgi:hypothetical protein